jgi:hypothetical protein
MQVLIARLIYAPLTRPWNDIKGGFSQVPFGCIEVASEIEAPIMLVNLV